jgi:predicted 2-oxoglutarate/Fe(II)-dependent dioxygenase YbiX
LSVRECRDVVAEIEGADREQVQVWRDDGFGVDDDSRRGAIARLTPPTEDLVQNRLWAVVPGLEARFGCEVSHLSGVTALIYGAGDHFAAHSDGGGDDSAPDEVRRRRVSLVVALNAGAGDAADFSGGELEFYAGSLPASAAAATPVMTVRSSPGLLIAFGSSMIHRVAPVVAGRRYSLALWALAP